MITPSFACSDQLKKYHPDYVLYRDKKNSNYDNDAEKFVKLCREFKRTKSFIHQDADLAEKLGADGVHLTSNQFDKIAKAKDKGLEVIISTHTLDEVIKAQSFGADAVTYSPIFATPNKGEPKGIDTLKNLLYTVDIKVFALGGITSQKEIKEIEKTNVYGFASIRYFC